MKWLLLVIIPPVLHEFGIDLSLELFGGIILAGFAGVFADWQTVDNKAQDKALEIVTRGGRKYSPERSRREMFIFGALAAGFIALVSQGEAFTGDGLPLLIGLALGFILGVLFAPEPHEMDVQKYVEKLQREQAMKYMKDLRRSDPTAYRAELSRLKAIQAEQGGELPPDLERDCERMGVDGSECEGASSLLRLL